MESLGFTGEVRGTPEQHGMGALASVSETEQPRYIPGRHARLNELLVLALRASSRPPRRAARDVC